LSNMGVAPEVVQIDWFMCHFAWCQISLEHVVVLSLSRVHFNPLPLHFFANQMTGLTSYLYCAWFMYMEVHRGYMMYIHLWNWFIGWWICRAPGNHLMVSSLRSGDDQVMIGWWVGDWFRLCKDLKFLFAFK
jgi:hypothetical protein